MPLRIKSIGRLAQENKAWKITNSKPARIISPQNGCSTQLSSCSCNRCLVGASGAAMAKMRRTSRCSAAALAGCAGGNVTAGAFSQVDAGKVQRASSSSNLA